MSANSRMITNLYSVLYWMLMAGLVLSNPLTNPLLYARSLMHTLLSHDPAILLLEMTNLDLIIKEEKPMKTS